jgi:hypothetical protein
VHCKTLSSTHLNILASSVVIVAQNPVMTSLTLLGGTAQHEEELHNMLLQVSPQEKATVVRSSKEGYKFSSTQITHLLTCYIQPVLDIFC